MQVLNRGAQPLLPRLVGRGKYPPAVAHVNAGRRVGRVKSQPAQVIYRHDAAAGHLTEHVAAGVHGGQHRITAGTVAATA